VAANLTFEGLGTEQRPSSSNQPLAIESGSQPLNDVVWGNHDAIAQGLASLGKIRPSSEWFGLWNTSR